MRRLRSSKSRETLTSQPIRTAPLAPHLISELRYIKMGALSGQRQSNSVKPSQTDVPGHTARLFKFKCFNMNNLRNKRRSNESRAPKSGLSSNLDPKVIGKNILFASYALCSIRERCILLCSDYFAFDPSHKVKPSRSGSQSAAVMHKGGENYTTSMKGRARTMSPCSTDFAATSR